MGFLIMLYRDDLESLLIKAFIPIGYKLTTAVQVDVIPESANYNALSFSLNNNKIIYRKAKLTETRPGAFLTLWKRPKALSANTNKPIPYDVSELDYLFVDVEEGPLRRGIFIFPVALLVNKGIVRSDKSKGKTAFRVFPAWSRDRGVSGTQVFSESAKKTQQWQLPYFVQCHDSEIDADLLVGILAS